MAPPTASSAEEEQAVKEESETVSVLSLGIRADIAAPGFVDVVRTKFEKEEDVIVTVVATSKTGEEMDVGEEVPERIREESVRVPSAATNKGHVRAEMEKLIESKVIWEPPTMKMPFWLSMEETRLDTAEFDEPLIVSVRLLSSNKVHVVSAGWAVESFRVI